MHRLFALDAATGQLASYATPPERIVEHVYTVLPAEAVDWGKARGLAMGNWLLETGTSKLETPNQLSASSFQLIITSPHQGSVYRLDPALPRGDQRIEIAARASDEVSVARLTIYVDEGPLADMVAPPYRALWPLAPGEHTITAVGYDPVGNRLESQPVHITVK